MASKKRGIRQPRRIMSLGKKQLAKLAAQEQNRKQARKQAQQRKIAIEARDKYKARKKDLGKIVFIGVHGQKTAREKGRKGFLIYVTKTGKKWYIRQQVKRGEYKPRKFAEIQPGPNKTLRNKAKKFQHSKLEIIGKGRAAVKGKGEVKTGGPWDFSDRVVSKIAKSIKATIERVASHRVFNIRVKVLFINMDGSYETMEFSVPIEKPDHIAIHIEGLKNFVSQKFYAFLAQELFMLGYVTAGSSNHVRSLSVNQGKERSDWRKPYEDDKGKLRLMPWRGADKDTVTIKAIEWQLEQAKIV